MIETHGWRVHAFAEPGAAAPLVWERLTLADPGPGEALVRVTAAVVSHLDLTVASGRFDLRPSLPYAAGVEGAGVVLAGGGYAPGTPVLLSGGRLGVGGSGTWSEQAVVSTAALQPLPVALDPVIAAGGYDPVTTAHVALTEVGRLNEWPGTEGAETVLVAGAAGAVGGLVVQLALAAGARVVGLVSRGGRLADVPAGAEAVSLTDPDAVARLAERRASTLLVDTWGGPGLADRLGWVCSGGRAAVVGYTQGTTTPLPLPHWLFTDVAILPVNLIARADAAVAAAPELLGKLGNGTLHLPVERLPLSSAPEAARLLSSGRARGRVVLACAAGPPR